MAAASRDVLSPILATLLDCAHTALCDIDRDPGRSFISPGEVAWDDCCEGQLAVRVIEMYPTNPFPDRDTRPRCAPLMWAARVGVSVIRCSPSVSDEGTAPAAGDLTENANGILQDAAAIRDAILCCFTADGATRNLQGWVIDTWTPLGPQGGCAGGEWTLYLGVASCSCPDPEG